MILRGRVTKYGNDVDTDVIIPSKYLVNTDPKELAKHAMEGMDTTFLERVKERRILAAGLNFGCGSSREQAPVALKYAGVQGIVSESFARIFYRNAVNIGLPVLECPGVAEATNDGDEVEIDVNTGIIRNLTNGKELQGNPTPEFLLRIMEKGLVQYVREGRK